MTSPPPRPRADVHVARPLCELVDDMPWCIGDDHEVCAVGPVAASWPVPNVLSDLDDDAGG